MNPNSLIRLADNKYNRLLTVLFFLLLTIFLPSHYDVAQAISLMLCLIAILSIVWRTKPDRRLFGCYAVLVIGSLIMLAARLLGILSPPLSYYSQISQIVSGGILLVILGFPIPLIQKEIFLTSKVTADTFKGGIAAYILLALAWSTFYNLLYVIDSNAFAGISALQSQADLLHFSFVTLTTVGYGDIHPVTGLARISANLEAVTGVMYPSILIARLVSLYEANSKEVS